MGADKLNPAIEALIKTFGEKGGGGEVGELLNLISGIVACSAPGALKECCTGKEDLEAAAFKAALLSFVEDSVRGILEEDGVAPSGSMGEDIRQLFDLAKDLGSGKESFFSKVSEVTEGRRSGKFMESLLSNLSATGKLKKGGMNTEDILAKMINIMGSRVTLQEGFRDVLEKILLCCCGRTSSRFLISPLGE